MPIKSIADANSKWHVTSLIIILFQRANNKGADQTVWIHRMVCALLFACNKISCCFFARAVADPEGWGWGGEGFARTPLLDNIIHFMENFQIKIGKIN